MFDLALSEATSLQATSSSETLPQKSFLYQNFNGCISIVHFLLSISTITDLEKENNLFVLQFLPELLKILKVALTFDELIEIFLSKDDLDRTLIFYCCEFGLFQELDIILSFISNLKQSESSESEVSTFNSTKFLSELVLEKNIFKRTCFHEICCSGKYELLKVIKKYISLDLNNDILFEQDYEGNTFLHLLAIHNSTNDSLFESFKTYFNFDINLYFKNNNNDITQIKGDVESEKKREEVMKFKNFSNYTISDLLSQSQIILSNIEYKIGIISHDIFLEHHTFNKEEDEEDIPVENINRIKVLINENYGILNNNTLIDHLRFIQSRKAEISDILRVHEYSYIEKLIRFCEQIESKTQIKSLDGDTNISKLSYTAATYAAGSVCQAIDLLIQQNITSEEEDNDEIGSKRQRSETTVQQQKLKNIFCVVRPPGHHAGSCGAVSNEPDSGSYGFCLINNIAIGAAYARQVHRSLIKRVAIIDFDVHHGNGTEECIRNTVPFTKNITLSNRNLRENLLKHSSTMKYDVRDKEQGTESEKEVVCKKDIKFNLMEPSLNTLEINIKEEKYYPWLNENDHQNTFFASVHGYGRRIPNMNSIPLEIEIPKLGKFYPASGKTYSNVHTFEEQDEEEELVQEKEPNIINVGQQTTSKEEWKHSWKYNILPALFDFNPDLILISAGFDAHKRDDINMGYIGVDEVDFHWLTKELVKISNSCCEGKLVSVLEGGYNIAGRTNSPFSKSVLAHVNALHETQPYEIYSKPDPFQEPDEQQNEETELEQEQQQQDEEVELEQEHQGEENMEVMDT